MARIYSDMHCHILDCFSEAGVEILSPIYQAYRDGNALAMPEVGQPPYSAASTPVTKKRVSPSQKMRKKRSS